jgi:hypothetical protein
MVARGVKIRYLEAGKWCGRTENDVNLSMHLIFKNSFNIFYHFVRAFFNVRICMSLRIFFKFFKYHYLCIPK